MKISTVAVLMVSLAIAAFVGWQVFGAIGDQLEQDKEWCTDHGGHLKAHNEILYCDLPEKNVLTSDLMEHNYPNNASEVPHTDMETYRATPPLNLFGVGIVVAIGLGGGSAIAFINGYRD